jgi:hypothetical protein
MQGAHHAKSQGGSGFSLGTPLLPLLLTLHTQCASRGRLFNVPFSAAKIIRLELLDHYVL